MPRPRIHDRDVVLDAAEALAVQAGPAGVTTRAVAAMAGVSNGAIYHSFRSRADLVAQTWLRAARRFLDVQSELVDAALTGPDADPIMAVAAAADAPAVFHQRHQPSSQLLVRVNRSELLGTDVSGRVATELAETNQALTGLLVRLAQNLWNRHDAAAVDAITLCIVDLPTAFLLSRNRIDSSWARTRLHSAVRSVLQDGPPPAHPRIKE